MRLLNTSTYEVREFLVDIPHYVILSHTWGAEEVTYYDVVNKAGLEAVSWKQGYAKLTGFCKEAARNGFRWVWMDSCCIDKTSSAELSEAINSMFYWYKDAVVCYVYLFDYLASKDLEFHFVVSGARCRWFTRSWTLQELLAPENAVFYDQNWKDCGTKRALADAIAGITGIDRKLLVGETRITDYSVAQKMSWASMRDATRVEDMAYSLLGLFDLNMPLLYGEGLRSFARLQEEIIKTSTDQTIFAWKKGWLHTVERDSDRGLLASSPADFRNSSRIVQASGQMLDSMECYITNRGLLMNLPLYQEDDKYVGVLDCCDVDHPETRIGILLQTFSNPSIERTSKTHPQLTDQGDRSSLSRTPYWRIAPDLVRYVPREVADQTPRVPLTIYPIWVHPTSQASRFPLVDVSFVCDLGDSGFSQVGSSVLLIQDSSRRIISYTFDNSAGRSFGVKLQVDNGVKGLVPSQLEVMIAGRSALEDWTTEPVAIPADQVEAMIGDSTWRLSTKVRHRIKENRRGQVLSLILHILLENTSLGD